MQLYFLFPPAHFSKNYPMLYSKLTGLPVVLCFYLAPAHAQGNPIQGNIGIGVAQPSRFKLEIAGNTGPEADSLRSLGAADRRWKQLFSFSVRDGHANLLELHDTSGLFPGVRIYTGDPAARAVLGIQSAGGRLVLSNQPDGMASHFEISNLHSGKGLLFTTDGAERARFAPHTGHLLIGTTSDYYNGSVLQVGARADFADTVWIHGQLVVADGSEVTGALLTSDADGYARWQPPLFKQNNTGATIFSTDTTAAFAIGTGMTVPGYKLMVGGGIIAEHLRLKLRNASWPDYVFEPGYPLRSLDELSSFIAKYRHLPGVPSAASISRSGVDVSGMLVVLLEKTEELYKYILQLNDELVLLRSRLKIK